jgi:simple sugar transport system permease protein
MLNFLMVYLAQFLVGGPWQRPGSPYPETNLIANSAFFPKLIPGTSFHLGDLLSFIFVIIVYFLIFRTTIGFKIRAIGSNPIASALKGLSVNKILLLSIFLSGGLAGLAGVSQLGGVYHRVTYETVLLGVGYVGILITFLGRNHPIWITAASLFFGGLVVGGENMTMVVGVPTSFTLVLQILILLLILVMDKLATYEIKIRRLV